MHVSSIILYDHKCSESCEETVWTIIITHASSPFGGRYCHLVVTSVFAASCVRLGLWSSIIDVLMVWTFLNDWRIWHCPSVFMLNALSQARIAPKFVNQLHVVGLSVVITSILVFGLIDSYNSYRCCPFSCSFDEGGGGCMYLLSYNSLSRFVTGNQWLDAKFCEVVLLKRYDEKINFFGDNLCI